MASVTEGTAGGTWSLRVSKKGIQTNALDDMVIWSGPKGTAPTDMIRICPELTPIQLASLAMQVTQHAPIASLPNLLAGLACCPSFKPERLYSLPNSQPRTVCGVVFKKGEIVWTCRSCAKDPTCVQCDACFRKSNHEGHEVYFHRSSGRGGCCDCGDPEAWSAAGNCCDHHSHAANFADMDPSTTLPDDVHKGFQAVVSGILQAVLHYATATVRGFEPMNDNIFFKREDPINPATLVARLHNDDVHTYDDVIGALIRCGKTRNVANTLTTAVDHQGHAAIYVGTKSPEITRISDILSRDAGLLFSVTTEEIVNMENNVVAAFSWLLHFGNSNDALARVVAQVLCNDDEEGFTQELFSPEFATTFPLSIRFLRTNDNSKWMNHTPPCDPAFLHLIMHPFDHCPRTPLGVLLMASPFLGPLLCKSLSDLIMIYQQDALFKAVFSQIITTLYPSLYTLYFRSIGTAKDTIFQTTVQVYTADSVVTMMSSEGVFTRPLDARIPELPLWAPPQDMGGGRIQNFLSTAAQGLGLRDELIKVVNTIDSNKGRRGGALAAPGPTATHPFPIHITRLLTSTLLHVLVDLSAVAESGTGAGRRPSPTPVVSHASIQKRRYNHLCRDLEYCTENPVSCLNMLCGERDGGMVEDWLTICCLLQGIDPQRRRTDVHVEREDEHWQFAANLVLELESVSFAFLSKAFLAKDAPPSLVNKPTGGSEPFSTLCQRAVRVVFEKALVALRHWAVYGTPDSQLFFDHSASTASFPVLILGTRLRFPGVRRYTVSFSPISVHLPLHRFASKLLDLASAGGVQLTQVIRLLQDEQHRPAVIVLADYPLRCMAFAAQVLNAMWRRNGQVAANLAFNYERPPLCRTLRNNDLICIQASILALGPAPILALALDRFEVQTYLENKYQRQTTAEHDNLMEYRGGLLAEMLRTLILMVCYLPVALVESSADDTNAKSAAGVASSGNSGNDIAGRSGEKVKQAMRREVAHLLLSGDTTTLTISQLQRAKLMIGSNEFVTDKTMREVVEDVCERREDDSSTARVILEPRPLSYDLFDPEYINFTSQLQQVAMDRVREYRKKTVTSTTSTASTENPPSLPVLSYAAIPQPHPTFATVRRMLYHPFTCRVLETALDLCLDNNNAADATTTTATGKTSTMSQGCLVMIVSRVIHLVTLQIHCQAPMAAIDAMEMKTLGVGDDEELARGAAAQYYTSFFKPISMRGADGKPWVLSASSVDGILRGSYDGAGRGMLTALAKVSLSAILRDDPYYTSGLRWLLQQLANQSLHAMTFLAEQGISFNASTGNDTDSNALAKRRSDAQRRAMSAMGRQAKSFANSAAFSMEDDDEDDDNVDEPTDKTPEDTVLDLEEGAPECIFCRERKSGSEGQCGYLSVAQISTNTKLALSGATTDCPGLRFVYRVVAMDGCDVHGAPSETAKVIGHMAHGTHILVKHRRQRLWMRALQPVKGWIPLYQTIQPKPKKVSWEDEDHPSGTSSSSASSSSSVDDTIAREALRFQYARRDKPTGFASKLEVCLHPVTDLMFNRHGGSRVHVSSCGHSMHLACYQRVRDTQNAASRGRNHYPDSQAIDAKKGEMLCPLCKSLVNTLVPHVPFAATKLLARRLTSALPSSSTSTAMVVQLPDSSTSSFSSSSSSLLSFLAGPFVPQNWYHFIQQRQLLPSSSPPSEAADSTTSASTPLQRYYVQANITTCINSYDQALQALCGTTPPLPASVESSPLRSFHRLCGAVAYTVQSACLAKSWSRVGRITTISTSTTGSGTSSAAVSDSSRGNIPPMAPKCGVLSKESESKEVAFLSQLLFGLMLSVRQQMEQQGQLEQLYTGMKKSNNQGGHGLAAELLQSLWSPCMGETSLEEAQRKVIGKSEGIMMTTEGEGEGEGVGKSTGAMVMASWKDEPEETFVLKGGFGGSGTGVGESRMTIDEEATSPSSHETCEIVPLDPTATSDSANAVVRRKVLVDALLHQPFCTVPEPTVLSSFSMLEHLKPEWHARSHLAEWHHSAIVDVWMIFRQPLLMQDLQMMTVAVMAVSRDLETAMELLQIMVWARLAQLLLEPGSTGVLAANTAKVVRELEDATAKERGGDVPTVSSLLSAGHTRIMVDVDMVSVSTTVGSDTGTTTMTLPLSSEPSRPLPVQPHGSPSSADSSRKQHTPHSPDSPPYREGGVRKRAKTTTSPNATTEDAGSTSMAVMCGRRLLMLQKVLHGRSSSSSSSSSATSSSATSSSATSSSSAIDPSSQGKMGGPVNDDMFHSSSVDTDDETAAGLFAWVTDSWTPFVEYAATIHMLLMSSSTSLPSTSFMTTNQSSSASSNARSMQDTLTPLNPSATYLEQQLQSMGVVALDSGLLQAFSFPALSGIFLTWAQQIPSLMLSHDERQSNATDSNVPRPSSSGRSRDDGSHWIPSHEPSPTSTRKKSLRSEESRDMSAVADVSITSPYASSSSGRLSGMMDVQGGTGAYPDSEEDDDDEAYVNEDEEDEEEEDEGDVGEEEELDNEEDDEEEEEEEDQEGDEGLMDFIVDDEGDNGDMEVEDEQGGPWGGMEALMGGPPPLFPPGFDGGEMPMAMPGMPGDDALLQMLMQQLGANGPNQVADAPPGVQEMIQQLQAIIGQGGGELVIPGELLGDMGGPEAGGIPPIQIQMGIGAGPMPPGGLPMGMMMGAGPGPGPGPAGMFPLGALGGGPPREPENGSLVAVPPGSVKTLWHMVGIDPLYKQVDGFSLPKEKIPQGLLGTVDIDPLLTRTPLVGSLSGRDSVFGLRGTCSSHGYHDLSHLSVGSRHRGGLIRLPNAYTDLHRIATFPSTMSSASIDEPAICLLCGSVLQSGTKGTARAPASVVAPMDIGECTLHARSCGAGIGIFYHLTKVQVLLIRGRLACVYPSIYIDINGEVPDAHGLLRPMFLSNKAYAKLEELYLTHQVAREVTRSRASADRVLRADWY